MAKFTQTGGGVKRVIRGLTSASGNITIPRVDPGKTLTTFLGTSGSAGGTSPIFPGYVRLVDGSTVNVQVPAGGTLSWELVEYS